MALIIGVRPGERIYLNDEPLRLLRFKGHEYAKLKFRQREIEITDTKATELMPGVYISCGLPRLAREGRQVMPHLVIDAPRSMTILREELYGKSRPEKKFSDPGIAAATSGDAGSNVVCATGDA